MIPDCLCLSFVSPFRLFNVRIAPLWLSCQPVVLCDKFLQPFSKLKLFIGRILSAQSDSVVHADLPGLLEPLTAREEEIVRLLATELSAKGIADYLVVSVATVRAHIRSIYSKMDVHGRAEAVQGAKDLGIL